jgi:hypothetical protein
MPSESVLARILEFLESIWSRPAAAAQFAESPDTALASHDLSRADLAGVDLRSVAGGMQGAGGISPEGRLALRQFAQSPDAPHGSAVQHIGSLTRHVHRDDPTVQKLFVDHSQTFTIDNSQTLVNNGLVDGDITFDNDVNVATGRGVIVGENSQATVANGAGSVAQSGGGDVVQAEDSAVLTGGDGDGGEGGQGGQGQEDLPFGDGDTAGEGHRAEGGDQGRHDGRQPDVHDENDQQSDAHREPAGVPGGQDSQGRDPAHDPTAAEADPTLVEGSPEQQEMVQPHEGLEADGTSDVHHDAGGDQLLHA